MELEVQKIQVDLTRKLLFNPGPATTSLEVKKSLLISDLCPRELEFQEVVREIFQLFVQINAPFIDYETILIPGSGTTVMEASLSSLVPEGSSCLVVENGAYGKRMEQIANVFGINVIKAGFNWGEEICLKKVEGLLEEFQREISYVIFVHHETTTGMLNPLGKLIALSRKYKKKVIVDAISSYAGEIIDFGENGADVVLTTSNKCIQGFPGLGIIFLKKQLLEDREGLITPRTFSMDIFRLHESFKKNFQFLFTPPVQVVNSLRQALIELKNETIEGRIRRYGLLHESLLEGMRALGFQLFLKDGPRSRVLTSFDYLKHPNFSFNRLHDFLFDKGITIYPGKISSGDTFRISVLGDLTLSDIETLLLFIKEYLKNEGIK